MPDRRQQIHFCSLYLRRSSWLLKHAFAAGQVSTSQEIYSIPAGSSFATSTEACGQRGSQILDELKEQCAS